MICQWLNNSFFKGYYRFICWNQIILSIVLPKAATEERLRGEIYNTFRSLDDMKEELGK